MTTDLNRTSYLPQLTGIRGLAALWVAVLHWQYNFTFSRDFYFSIFLTRVVQKGYLAVDVFFVLSGFVMAHMARDWDGSKPLNYFPNFIRRRLARIYPLHALVTLTMFLVFVLKASKIAWGDWFTSLAAHLALVQAWGMMITPDWNFPSWSISAEWSVYLLFPFILPLHRKFSQRPWQMLIGALVATGSITAIAIMFNRGSLNVTWDWGCVRAFCEFWIGLTTYTIYQRVSDKVSREASGYLSFAALVSFALFLIFQIPDAFIIPIAALLALSAALGGRPTDVIFGNRVSHFLGEISYSIYMLHIPIGLSFLSRWPQVFGERQSGAMGFAAFACAMLLLLACSALVHFYFERPLRRRLSAASSRSMP